jgi:phosphate-selective porin OprO/OprP
MRPDCRTLHEQPFGKPGQFVARRAESAQARQASDIVRPAGLPHSAAGMLGLGRSPLGARPLTAAVALLVAFASAPLLAQAAPPAQPDGKPPIIEVPHLLQPGGFDKRYAIPDLAPDRLLFPRINTPIFTIRPGIEMILDYTAFGQDDTSLAQVGEQLDGFDVRSASLNFEGELGPKRAMGYKVGVAYNGFNSESDQDFTVTDFNFFFAIPRWRTQVRIGMMQEDLGYEVIGSTATMPQSERVLTPFASPINPGIKITHILGNTQRGTLTYGVFKDDWGERDGRAAISARATALVVDGPTQWLHLGVAIRRANIDEQTRYRGKPGVAAADEFVDTGEFEASSTTHFGLEANYAQGPFSIIGEYATARPDIPVGQDPVFRGFYLLGSWVLTGEQRDYDRTRGTVKRILPKGRWGAPELVARYSSVDLSSNGIDGGRYDRIEMGANWWATTRWKFGLLYGHVWLDRQGQTGQTDTLLTRLQWVY